MMRRKYECYAYTVCTILNIPPLKVRFRSSPVHNGEHYVEALYSDKWNVLYINENAADLQRIYEDITYEIYKFWLNQRQMVKTDEEMRQFSRKTVVKLFHIA